MKVMRDYVSTFEKPKSLLDFLDVFMVLVEKTLHVNTLFMERDCPCGIRSWAGFIGSLREKFGVSTIHLYFYQASGFAEIVHPDEYRNRWNNGSEWGLVCNAVPAIEGVEYHFLGKLEEEKNQGEELSRWRTSLKA